MWTRAALINFAFLAGAFYLGYSGQHWYGAIALGLILGSISLKKMTDEKVPILTWIGAWLFMCAAMTALALTFYFVGVWVQ